MYNFYSRLTLILKLTAAAVVKAAADKTGNNKLVLFNCTNDVLEFMSIVVHIYIVDIKNLNKIFYVVLNNVNLMTNWKHKNPFWVPYNYSMCSFAATQLFVNYMSSTHVINELSCSTFIILFSWKCGFETDSMMISEP